MTFIVGLLRDLRVPLFRNAYALLIGTVLTSGLGIVYWAAAARLFPTEDVGIAASLVSTLMFVSGVSQLNLRSMLFRFAPVAGPALGRLMSGTYAFVAASSILLGTGTALILSLFRAVPPDAATSEATKIALFVVACVIWSIFSLQDSVLASLRFTIWVPITNFIFAVAKIGLLLVFLSVHPFGVFLSWMASALLGLIAVSGWVFFRMLPRHRPVSNGKGISVREITRYAAADYAAGIFSTSSSALLPVLVFTSLGAEASAYFYPVWLVFNMLRLAPQAMFSSLLVETAAGYADFLRDGRRVLLQVALTIGLPLLVLEVAAFPVLQIFGTRYATAGVDPMRLLAVSVVPFTINNFAAYFARSQGRMRQVIAIEAGAALPSLVFSLALMPYLGLAGVGWGVLIGQSLVAVAILLRSVGGLPALDPRMAPRSSEPREDASATEP